MKITAREIQHQRFPRRIRGYDADEVDLFLEGVASDMEALIKERDQHRHGVVALERKVAEFRELERTLRDTLMMAQRISAETEGSAQRRADALQGQARMRGEAIVGEAESRGREILVEAEDRRREVLLDLDALESRRAYALSRLRSLLEDQQAIVDAHAKPAASDEPDSSRVFSIPQSKRETPPTTE